MPVAFVEDARDPRLAPYADVARHERLAGAGRFVVEGRLGVSRLLAGRPHAIESLMLGEAAHRALAAELAERAPEVPVYVCRADFFERVTGHDFHRGCLALVRRPEPLEVPALLATARVVVVLDGVANPDNVGGVFRNAWAFGVDAVLLSASSADPLYRKSVRTSLGATLAVPFAILPERVPWADRLAPLARHRHVLLALTPRPPAVALDAFAARSPRPEKFALLVGGEGEGLCPELEALANERVRIPMRRGVDSLNLSVACGIALSWLCAPEAD